MYSYILGHVLPLLATYEKISKSDLTFILSIGYISPTKTKIKFA